MPGKPGRDRTDATVRARVGDLSGAVAAGNNFTEDDMRNVGAWYQGGPDFYATNPRSQAYGNRIVEWQPMLQGLLG